MRGDPKAVFGGLQARSTVVSAAGAAAVVFCVVLAASLFGILTRPLGFLAAFWPANAVLLGLFLRFPRLASPYGWIAAAVGYLAADFATGGAVLLTLWLTAANLAGVAAGCYLARHVDGAGLDLRQPRAMFHLFLVCIVAAAASTLAGAGVAPVMFGRDLASGAAYWFTTELANSVIVLPVMMSLPLPGAGLRRKSGRRGRTLRQAVLHGLPILSVVASVFAAVVIGGPGALAFPVPALIWCALTYDVFGTALITMSVCVWKMTAVSSGWVPLPHLSDFMSAAVSLRLGITLLAMAPLVVASLNASRNDMLRRLDRAANVDALTGALSKRAFHQRAEQALADRPAGVQASVLMMDLDHFKRVNDQYGHQAGDQVLEEFGARVRALLREGDLFGRLGGEEFAILLLGLPVQDVQRIAERVRASIENTPMRLDNGLALRVTSSFGLAHAGPDSGPVPIDRFLLQADKALYGAKAAGRNNVVTVPVHS